jgi:hypothetical protein
MRSIGSTPTWERGANGLIRIPYRWHGKGKLAVADRVDDIDWVYHVGFGQDDRPAPNE